MFKKNSLLLGITILLSFPMLVFAKPVKVLLSLKLIELHATQEKRGDEIYLSITEYSNKAKRPKLFRMPMFPTHWFSRQLSSVKNVVLWESVLESKEVVKLVVSLIEQDAPPWNVDDHIGSVKLALANDLNEGGLKLVWSKPDFKEDFEIIRIKSEKMPTFILKGDGAEYKVRFEVKAEVL